MAIGEFAYAMNSNRFLASAFIWPYLCGQVAKLAVPATTASGQGA
ncbi:MAG: hypothetical protein ABJA49_03545 [Betaproteobacteria bacterium]